MIGSQVWVSQTRAVVSQPAEMPAGRRARHHGRDAIRMTGEGAAPVRIVTVQRWINRSSAAEASRLPSGLRRKRRPVPLFSSMTERLASAAEDRLIHLWQVDNSSRSGTLTGQTDRVPAMVWHPDGRRLISAGWDTTARVWDTQTCEPIILPTVTPARYIPLP